MQDDAPEMLCCVEAQKASLFERIIRHIVGALSRLNRRCRHVEQAKAVAERENTRKHGKDWVNRCCG